MSKIVKNKTSFAFVAALTVFLVFTQLQTLPAFALDFTTQKITVPNSNEFGWSVHKTDSGLAVGEPFGDSDSGNVYIFDSDLALTSTIANPNVGGDNFGYSLSSQGTTLAVGAPGYDNNKGTVYLYDISNPSAPTLALPSGILNPSNTNGERMGEDDIDFLGGDLLVGVSKATNVGNAQAGKIYQFSTSDGSLTTTYSDPSHIMTNDMFGRSISTAGTLFLTGAPGADNEAGHATVLGSSSISFSNPNISTPVGDKYGWSTEITPDRYLVGAPNAEASYGNLIVSQGAVYAHHIDNSDVGILNSPDIADLDLSQNVEDQFGYNISESNGFIAVSAPYDDVELDGQTYQDAGSVYLFSPSGYSIATIHNPDPANGDLFGHSLEIVNGFLIIGAPGDDGNHGAVYAMSISNDFAISITPDANPNPVPIGGDTTITFTVKNIGSADLFSPTFTITSPNCETIDGPFVSDEDDGILQKGEEWTFTCQVTNVQQPFTASVNEGSTSVNYYPDPLEDPVDVNCGEQNFDCTDTDEVALLGSSVTLDISANHTTIYTGEHSTVTFTLTNEGNDIRYINEGDIDVQGCTPLVDDSYPISLIPQGFIDFTCDVTGGTSNIDINADITTSDQNGNPTTTSGSLTIHVLAPAITLDISSDPNPVTSGATSLVTYNITNTGNVPVIIDSQTDLVENSGACTPTAQTTLPITLQQNDFVIFTCIITAGTTDIQLDATATATDENNNQVSDSSQYNIDVVQNIVLSGIIRDFKISHPDFEYKIADDDGIVKADLGSNGEPVYNGNPLTGTVTTTGLVNYDQWYNHVNGINDCTQYSITLTPTNSGTFKYANNAFFPIDNQLFGNEGKSHNYHFTYQVHATFVYQPDQTITMTGDDDVWVFINNKLALDQGGVLPPRTGTINLNTLNLIQGQTYSFDLFFAERHTVQSNLGIETNIPLIQSTPAQCKAVDAVDDVATSTQTPTTIDVLSNDSTGTTISTFTQSSHGSVAPQGNQLVYTPQSGFIGTDFFTYTVSNGSASDTATVRVDVFPFDVTFCPSPPSFYDKIIIGDNNKNNLIGTQGNDLIIGLGGDDKIQGKKGNDCLIGGDGDDKIWGGIGKDTIIGGNGNNQLHGNQDDDKITSGSGDDKIWGGIGKDNIEAGDGNNRINGNQDNDIIRTDSGSDWISGGEGDDTINAGDGADKLFGKQGKDSLYGEAGNDMISGGQGDDKLYGGSDYDQCDGNQGKNYIDTSCESQKPMKEDNDDDEEAEGDEEENYHDNGHGNDNGHGR